MQDKYFPAPENLILKSADLLLGKTQIVGQFMDQSPADLFGELAAIAALGQKILSVEDNLIRTAAG